MGTIVGEVIGKIATLLGFDGSDFVPLAIDSTGRPKALAGYDGENYLPIAVDADGHPQVKISGQVPDADTVDGHHASEFASGTEGVADDSDKVDGLHAVAFVLKAGDTMSGALILPGAPTVDLHASTKKYVDDAVAGGGAPAADFGVWMPDAPPVSPSVYDDEFHDSSLDAKWLRYDHDNHLTTLEDETGLLSTLAASAARNVCGLYQAAPVPPWSVYSKVSPRSMGTINLMGLGIWQDATDYTKPCHVFGLRFYSGTSVRMIIERMTNYNTLDSAVMSNTDLGFCTDVWLVWDYDGTYIRAFASNDGVGFLQVYSAIAPYAVGHFGLASDNLQASALLYTRHQAFRVFPAVYNPEVAVLGDRVKVWRS